MSLLPQLRTKAKSLLTYRREFANWWQIAVARYWRPAEATLVELRIRSGGVLKCRPYCDHVVIGEIFVGRQYEPCLKFRDARVVWDIGSNIGCFPIWSARHLPEAEFFSFEPAAETYALLNSNQASNPSIRWRTFPFGLSDHDGSVRAFVPHGMFGEASAYAAEGRGVTFPLRDIFAVWEELGKPSIDILKVDCEGGEYAIFERLTDEMLGSITCILLEVHLLAGRDPAVMITRLQKAGFAISHWSRNANLIYAVRQA